MVSLSYSFPFPGIRLDDKTGWRKEITGMLRNVKSLVMQRPICQIQCILIAYVAAFTLISLLKYISFKKN
jgi:hypothetical protein